MPYFLIKYYLDSNFVGRSPLPVLTGVVGVSDAQPQSVQSVLGKYVAVARRQKNVVVPADLLDRVVLARHHHVLSTVVELNHGSPAFAFALGFTKHCVTE